MITSFQLFQLQTIDSQIDRDMKRIEAITQTIQNDEAVNQVRDALLHSEIEIKSTAKDFNALNDEIQAKKNKLSQSESSLYGGTINNPKELQDLQTEVSLLKRIISQLEDDLIEILIRQEAVEKKDLFIQDELKNALSNFETKKSLLTGENLKLEENIISFQEKRDAVINQLDDNTKQIYESLRSSKNGLAIAYLNEDTCSACGSYLTASQCQDARSPSKLFFCPSCGRIIHG